MKIFFLILLISSIMSGPFLNMNSSANKSDVILDESIGIVLWNRNILNDSSELSLSTEDLFEIEEALLAIAPYEAEYYDYLRKHNDLDSFEAEDIDLFLDICKRVKERLKHQTWAEIDKDDFRSLQLLKWLYAKKHNLFSFKDSWFFDSPFYFWDSDLLFKLQKDDSFEKFISRLSDKANNVILPEQPYSGYKFAFLDSSDIVFLKQKINLVADPQFKDNKSDLINSLDLALNDSSLVLSLAFLD